LTSGATQNIADERVEYYYDWLPAQFSDWSAVPSGFTAENVLGRLVMTRTGASRIVEQYSYTDGGQVKRKRVVAEGQTLEVAYEYDAEGRMSKVTGARGRKYKYTYTAAGRPFQLKEEQPFASDILHTTAVFDDQGRLQSVGGMLYQYNAMGQISRYTHSSYERDLQLRQCAGSE
jgi:hypothetical protein